MATFITKIVRNDTAGALTFEGRVIPSGETYQIQGVEEEDWIRNADVIAAINAGDLAVSDGVIFFSTTSEALEYFQYYPDSNNVQFVTPPSSETVETTFGVELPLTKINGSKALLAAAILSKVSLDDQKYGTLESKIIAGVGASVFVSNPGSDERLVIALASDVLGFYNESEGQSSTTSGSYQEKLELDIGIVDAGDYDLYWSCEVANSSGDKPIDVRVQRDNTETLAEVYEPTKFENEFLPFGGIKRLALTAGAHTFQMDWRRDNGEGGTARIRRARILVKRAS